MKNILLSCLGALTILSAQGQSIDSALMKYSDFLQEKAYLHYDKSLYAPGETIWFKAYMMEGILPAVGSKTLYVDWIGDNGAVLSHTVSPLVEGVSNGQFDIPSNYAGNFIHVRAYTKWMLNFDTAFLYNKDLRILSRPASAAKPARPSIIPSLQFFPEGGDAVTGLNNKIAFKASDQWGRPVNVRGVIQDSRGAVIDSLRTIHDGMGFFYLIPQEGITYSARWKDEKGALHISALPPSHATGVAMQVIVEGGKRIININCKNLSGGPQKQLHLIGTMNQRFAFRNDIPVTGNNLKRVVPINGLPSGILVITLFDADWNAVAERITFINNRDYTFEPAMEVSHWGLGKRKRNELLITVPDSLQGANLSISVTDAAIERDTSDNIVSHFLLSSEIKGRINDPAYYFSHDGDSVEQHLDLVMLTNGWRRFKWEEVAKGKMPVISYPRDTAYMSLSGRLFGVTKSQLSGKDNIVLLLREKDSASRMLILPVSTNGSFEDPGIVPFDTLQVYYSLKSKFFSQAEARFMTDRLPAPDYTAFSKGFTLYHPFFDTTGTYYHGNLASEAARIRDFQKGQVMETVTVTAKQKSPVQVLEEKYASGMFRGGDGYQFDLVNDPLAAAYPGILNYLQGKVAGLQINTGGGSSSLSWRGGAPQIYLDEVPTDVDMITSIPVSDIAYVKVLRPPFLGGMNGGNGAIAIYTRKGNDTQDSKGKGLSSNKIMAYTPIRQFYSPNYDRFDARNEQPDLRTTLYWNPLLQTNPQKNSVTLTFYNNDVTKSFRVVIEGMSKDGLLTHYEQIME